MSKKVSYAWVLLGLTHSSTVKFSVPIAVVLTLIDCVPSRQILWVLMAAADAGLVALTPLTNVQNTISLRILFRARTLLENILLIM